MLILLNVELLIVIVIMIVIDVVVMTKVQRPNQYHYAIKPLQSLPIYNKRR